jgi:dipeptidyl aminopeptidase/acylaminoacyl peptidase
VLVTADVATAGAASARVRRWLRRAVAVGAAAVSMGWVTRGVLTAAIALAPNAPLPWHQRTKMLTPASLQQRQVQTLRAPLAAAAGSLAAWVVEPAASAKGTLLLLHGVRMDRRSLAPLAASLADAGYQAVLVDLRGHGESDGSYLTYGGSDAPDLSRLLDRLAERGLALGPVGVYGFSYGGAVAIDLAARDERIKSVLAVSPFCSLRQVVGDYRRKYLPRWAELAPDAWFRDAVDAAALVGHFDAERASPLSNIAHVRAPVLLMHGDADTQVPLAHSQRLLEASAGHARLEIVRGATHESLSRADLQSVRSLVIRWFDESLGS